MSRIKQQIGKRLHRRQPAPEPPRFTMHVNSPESEWQQTKQLVVSGWLLAHGDRTVRGVRVFNGGKYTGLDYGIERFDVAKAYPEIDPEAALHSGFSGDLTYEEGNFEIQADLGEGWETLRSLNLHYSPEKLVGMLYNPQLAQLTAEHQNLLENKAKYYYEPASAAQYVRTDPEPRLVAFYLPQYHPIPENDKAWGRGFTEWTNVAAAQPRFVGHQQPFVPADLGYYDLRVEQTMKDQLDLAKKHGIYGFCFYYYWFSGKRLLEHPLNMFLEHKEWDFNFMIAWANENWTKRWDGLEDDVIVAQQYLDTDPLDFIKNVEPILLDPRYIRQEGKPVLIVYRGSRLKDPARYVSVWREYFRSKHQQELYVLSVLGLDIEDPKLYGFDAAIEFEPLTIAKRTDFSTKEPLPPKIHDSLLDKDFVGGVADYRQVALEPVPEENFPFPTHKSVMPSWDNDARKKGKNPTIFFGANPDIYGRWLNNVLEVESKKTKSPLVFINAWNEWAEGTVLEPTRHHGHALLNRTSEVLARYSKNLSNAQAFPLHGIKRKSSTTLAVVVHVFYEEEWAYISKRLSMLEGIQYDLFITLSSRCDKLAPAIRAAHPKVYIYHVPNRGRDILPFLFVANRLKDAGYESVLKLHTKRSTHRSDGKDWFTGVVNSLLPTKKHTRKILDLLHEGVAFVGPRGHYVSLQRYIGSNQEDVRVTLTRLYGEDRAGQILDAPEKHGYFAGSMFWARLDGIESMLNIMPIPEDFEAEAGQIDGTYAHALERMFTLMPVVEGKRIYESSPRGLYATELNAPTWEYPYAP